MHKFKFLLIALLALASTKCLALTSPTQCVANVPAGGTTDTITTIALPCALTTTLLLLTNTAGPNTTTAPTLQPLGSPAQIITRPDGSAIEPGDLGAIGNVALLTPTGVIWKLLNPATQAGTGIVNPGTIKELGYYGATGNTISGTFAPAGAYTWSALQTDTGGLLLSGTPTIAESFAGISGNFSLYQSSTASQAALMETGAHFGITSAVGSADILNFYKMALALDCTANSGSSSCWGSSIVANIGAGGTKRGGIALELDLNNTWGNYTGAPANPYAANLFISGSNTGGYSSCAICIAFGGTGPMWNFGIYFGQPGTNVFNTADIFDQATSPEFEVINGSHGIGADYAGGGISVADILAANNQVIIAAQDTTSANRNLMLLNSSNKLELGAAALVWIQANQSIMPALDNSYQLGTSGAAWSVVVATHYTANGVAGVTCASGVPTSSFSAQNGIITHC